MGVEVEPKTTVLTAEITGVNKGFESFGRLGIVTGTGCGGEEDRRDRRCDWVGIATVAAFAGVGGRFERGPVERGDPDYPNSARHG